MPQDHDVSASTMVGMRTADDAVALGIIGRDSISPGHILGFQISDGARVTVLCDLDPKKASKAEWGFGVSAVTNYRDVLTDPSVDPVVLLLPHQVHYSMAREALEAGKHVYVEKPFTIHEHEAEDLILLAAARGLTVALAENTGFVGAYIAAERVIASGQLGRYAPFVDPSQIKSLLNGPRKPTAGSGRAGELL